MFGWVLNVPLSKSELINQLGPSFYSLSFSSVSIVGFEQVNVSWVQRTYIFSISGFPHKQLKRFTSCLVRKMIKHQTKKIYLKKIHNKSKWKSKRSR